MGQEFVARKGLISKDDASVEGQLVVSQGITADSLNADNLTDGKILTTQNNTIISTNLDFSTVEGFASTTLIATISGDLQGQITSNDIDISGLRTDVDTISGDLDSLETQITNLDLTYATDTMVAGLTGNLQSQIDSNDTQLAGLVAISGDHETRILDLEDISDLDAKYVDVLGDTMTGSLVLSGADLSITNLASISGNFLTTDVEGIIGDSGINATTISNTTTFLQTQITTISGDLANLDLTYATDTMVAGLTGNLQGQITNNDTQLAGLVAISGDHETRILDLEDISDLDAKYVDVLGDTMTGSLIISGADLSITNLASISGNFLTTDYTGQLIDSGSNFANIVTSISASDVTYANANPWYYYNNGSPPTNVQDALDANARESFFGKHIALQQASTSVNQGGAISISGAESVTVEGGFGFWLDHTNFDSSGINPTFTKVTWPTQEATIPNISGGEYSFVYVDASDSLVKFQQTPPVPEDYRHKFLLGKVVHRDATTNFTVQLQPIGRDVYNQYSDLANAIGTVNIEGNIFSPANPSTNLTITKTAGKSFRLNSQTGDTDNPHTTSDPILDTDTGGDTFTYVYLDGAGGVTYANAQTEINPAHYDDGTGTLNPVTNNKYTVQRLYSFPKPSTGGGGKTYVFYGQALYDTLDDAIAGIETEDFTQPATNFYDASLRGWVITRSNITNFTNEARYKFVTAGKFGDSGAGSSVTASVGSTFRDDLFKIENDGDPSSFLNFSLQNILDSGETITINANALQDGDIELTLPAISGQLVVESQLDDLLDSQYVNVTGDTMTGDLGINGNLTINGNIVQISGSNITQIAETLTVEDNLIVINNGESGAGVSLGQAGFQIDRGSLDDYYFFFDENIDGGSFVIGISGDLQKVATEETISKSWSSLVNIWTEEPTFNINISGSGDVYDYVYDTTTYYRLVPEPYDSTQDTFYSNFNGTDTLTGVVATRGQGI